MKTSFFNVILTGALLASSLQAQEADQLINLVPGWNAVWLEVQPTYPEGHERAGRPMTPEDAFDTANNDAIDVIASPKPLAGLAEFFGSDPAAAGTFNQEGWEIWRRTEIDPNTLVTTTGNRAYLIENTAAATLTLTLTGEVRFFRPKWTPDRYNLIGFGIDANNPPNFDVFFGPSAGRHPVAGERRIFSLAADGNWTAVNGGAPMMPGAAYWIFSNGPSDYMGPVAVDFDLALTGTLNFGGPSDEVTVGDLELDLEEVTFTNLDAEEATPELELIAGSGELELHTARPAADSLGYVLDNQVDSTANDGASSDLQETVAATSTSILTLGAARNWTAGTVGRTNLYRLKPGGGGAFWLPIKALKTDLQLPTDTLPPTEAGALAGLWVGEAIMDRVTSIVEDGSPVRPSAGSAPVRVLLHSDAAGMVTLLSQVTIMQTKSADPEIAPVPVLVVDPRQIPFHEGVKERNGKRVGMRVQTVAYDMPRKLDAESQAALLNDDAFPQLTDANEIQDFLIGRGTRPPSLAEIYHLTWSLEGALGSGKTVRTNDALVLDPFHRSNPFRHAFHQQHTRGPNITRTLEIIFDTGQTGTDRLHGTFTDTINGLIKTTLTMSGRIELHRVSTISTL